jgi:hypothetical protein
MAEDMGTGDSAVADEGAEDTGGTTPAEVAEILHLDVPAATDENNENNDDEADESDKDKEEVAAEDDENEEKAVTDKPPTTVPPAAKTAATTDKTDKTEAVATDTPDFSMQVEDANGVTYKIAAGDNLDEVLANFEPKNNGQIMQILKDLGGLEAKQAEYQVAQEKQVEADRLAESIEHMQTTWQQEIAGLQGEGRIDKTAEGSSNARIDAVYAHMSEVNAARIAADKPPLNSFEDALNSLEIKEAKAAKEQAAKDAKDTSRANGGLVGGSSAPASSGQPQYTGGARTAAEALKMMKML